MPCPYRLRFFDKHFSDRGLLSCRISGLVHEIERLRGFAAVAVRRIGIDQRPHFILARRQILGEGQLINVEWLILSLPLDRCAMAIVEKTLIRLDKPVIRRIIQRHTRFERLRYRITRCTLPTNDNRQRITRRKWFLRQR